VTAEAYFLPRSTNTSLIIHKMLPTVSFNEYTDIYTVNLWRNNKEIIHDFNTPTLGLHHTDGFYYIWPHPDNEYARVPLSKEEFHFIKKRLDEIDEELSNYRLSKKNIRKYLFR